MWQQELRKGAISRPVDVEELEKGVKHSVSAVQVNSTVCVAMAGYTLYV